MATNFHYFHTADNVAGNATVTTGGTANSSYPLTNANAWTYAKLAAPSKLTGTSGDWIFDFGAAQRVDAVLVWHNLDASCAFAIQMNATNSWGSPTVAFSSTAAAKRADSYTVKIYKDLTGVSGYSASGFRYLRFNVSGTNSVAVGIKLMAFSRIRQTTRNIAWGLTFTEQHVSIDMSTDALVPWAYDLASAPRRLSCEISPAKDSDATAVKEWFRACGGRSGLTVIVPDPSSPDAILGRFSGGGGSSGAGVVVTSLDDTVKFTNNHAIKLSFDEVSAGDPEWI